MTRRNWQPFKEVSRYSIANKVNSLKPSQVFFLNIIVLGVSIFFLGLAIWVQHVDHRMPTYLHGYSEGTVITKGEAATTVDYVKSTIGKGIFAAPAGTHYLIVELTVNNISKNPINVFPSNDFYLKDPSGKVTFLTPYNLDQPFRGGELLPGDQIKGQLSYLVPVDSHQKLYVDAIWSGGVILFEVV